MYKLLLLFFCFNFILITCQTPPIDEIQQANIKIKSLIKILKAMIHTIAAFRSLFDDLEATGINATSAVSLSAIKHFTNSLNETGAQNGSSFSNC